MAETKKIILVTGANNGIGLEITRQLLSTASNHVLLGSRSAEKGKEAIQKLQSEEGLPGTVELLQLDVTDETGVEAAAKTVESKHGRLDALVNNACIAFTSGTTAQQLTACFNTNAVGAYLMGEYFAPLLRKSTSTPRIVNISSGAGSIGIRFDRSSPFKDLRAVPYRVSKASMNMVAAIQWYELGEEGFKVFIYGPGYTESGLGPRNKVEMGAKPTSVDAAPAVAMVMGERDEDDGKYVEFGNESFPW